MSLQTRTSPRFVTINSKLPNELLTMVFQFLPFDDLKKVLLVCRLAPCFVLYKDWFWILLLFVLCCSRRWREVGEQACLWTSFKLKFIVNYWAEVDIRDQPGGPSGTAGDLRKVLKFRRLSSFQQLTLDFFSNMDWEEYIYLFQVIIESSPSVLRLSLIENPLFFRGDLHATKARAQQLAEWVVRFQRVDFGSDGFLS